MRMERMSGLLGVYSMADWVSGFHRGFVDVHYSMWGIYMPSGYVGTLEKRGRQKDQAKDHEAIAENLRIAPNAHWRRLRVSSRSGPATKQPSAHKLNSARTTATKILDLNRSWYILPQPYPAQCIYVQVRILYTRAITTQPAPPAPRPPKFPPLIDPKDRTGQDQQRQQIPQIQGLGLENPLQKGQIDDGQLPGQTARHGVIEHFVAPQFDLSPQHAFALAAARQGVEHVEEDEARERHGGVAGRDGVVVGHFADVDDHGAEHDDGGRSKYTLDQRPGEDTSVFGTRRPGHDGGIDWLNAE